MRAMLTLDLPIRRSFAIVAILVTWTACNSVAAGLLPQEDLDSKIEVSISELVGEVVSSGGKPVDEAKVKIQILDYSNFKEGVDDKPVTIGSWEVRTEKGRFQIEAKKTFVAQDRVGLILDVEAKGYLPFKTYVAGQQWKGFDGQLEKVKLKQAVKVVGKIVPPASSAGTELQRPRFEVHEPRGLIHKEQRFHARKECETDGSFEFLVPEGIKLDLIASSDNFAPLKTDFRVQQSDVSAPKMSEHKIGNLHLQNGVVVSGRVLDREGEPVAGQVVQISQYFDLGNSTTAGVEAFAVTDDDGKYELPPRQGECNIFLAKQGKVGDQSVKTKGPLLTAKPIKLTLDRKKNADMEVDIKEASTRRIFGRVVLEDGSPGNAASISYLGSEQGMRYFSKRFDVGEKGEFEMETIEGTSFQFTVVSSSKDKDTYYDAKLSAASMSKFREHLDGEQGRAGQFFKLTAKADDVGPLEVVLVEKVRRDEMTMTDRIIDWFSGD